MVLGKVALSEIDCMHHRMDAYHGEDSFCLEQNTDPSLEAGEQGEGECSASFFTWFVIYTLTGETFGVDCSHRPKHCVESQR
jgi:hypothetical protein